MYDIATCLNKLKQIKTDIQNAIADKGGNVSTSTPFEEYAFLIENLSSGGIPLSLVEMADDILGDEEADIILRQRFLALSDSMEDILKRKFKAGTYLEQELDSLEELETIADSIILGE